MYEEHEDGSFTLHMCEWYEQGRRLVGEYETLATDPGSPSPTSGRPVSRSSSTIR